MTYQEWMAERGKKSIMAGPLAALPVSAPFKMNTRNTNGGHFKLKDMWYTYPLSIYRYLPILYFINHHQPTQRGTLPQHSPQHTNRENTPMT